jgi:DNA-binding transcriptional LysR family regulator
MDLVDLKSFAQVVRHGGFTAAERATGEPKAKLSRRVARLEASLGARLLERSTRSLRVTDVGREIFQQCELIAAGIDAAQAIATRSRSTVAGALRISCPPGLARYLGTDLLSSFLRRYPDVNLEMHLSSHRVDLIRERFDAAFRVDVDEHQDQTFVMRQLGRLERILVASPSLARTLDPIMIDSLATAPILSLGENVERDRWALIHTDGRRHVVTHRPRMVSNDSVVVREAAIDGLGVALLPVLTCAAEIARGGLVQILPQWHAPEGRIHLIFTAKKGMSTSLRAFIDHVAMAFSTSMRQTG